MPGDPVVMGYLAAAGDDLDATRRLAAPPANRLAAYHLQQAAEKLVKAVLVHRKIHPGVEHRIDVLVRMLDASDPWQPLLDPLDRFTPYATTYRYPSPTGRLKASPDAASVLAEVDELEKLLERARRELGSP
ncbi:HEPN domain-containing protein [Sorangium sp. So ce854]|uniref:HEPN domain-containing protein n=1 Tax=Sorangium sp. So ce854 TaxID=3133322 RepID=UPI003F5D6A17